ncbi:hypothetical protein JB92DRAFT_2909911 [Gautieria morchelliformis]|nr:hypothetical protein JB92DRAFT_2909911 [Gautieria morchelliformis]
MFPKVAAQIFHHTSRAAAAVQNQTSQAIRNAWQYQQATPSSSAGGGGVSPWGGLGSSSGWGGSSAGPGGAKYNAGSRFYSGYTGPGRSITQANSSSAQPDDNDERQILPVRIKAAAPSVRARPRSRSLSLSSQDRIDRGEGLGVLQVVQMRARHVFAAHRSISSADDSLPSVDGANRQVLVRRNSSSAHTIPPSDVDIDMPPMLLSALGEPELPESGVKSDLTDLAAPQSLNEPLIGDDLAFYERLRQASHDRDVPKVLDEITRYRAKSRVSVPCYNMAMQALLDNRVVGQPISLILELYNEMLERNLIPNLRTYRIMILSLCARDADVQRVISSLEARISRRTFTAREDAGDNTLDSQRLAHLRTENNFPSALTLFRAATTIRNLPLGLPEYNALLRSCAFHQDIEAALRVFAHMERFPGDPPSPATYALLITVFANKADLGGAQQVFNAFKEASAQNRIAWDWMPKTLQKQDPIPQTGERNDLSKNSQIQVWNKMIETRFKCGEPTAALDLFESMLDTPLGPAFKEVDAPLPNSITYTTIINGFCEAGDVQSALSWFDRLLAQDSVAENPYAPLSTPPRPDHLSWIAMIDTLARMGKVDDLNRLFLKLLEVAPQDRLPIRTVDRYVVFRANFDIIGRASELLKFVLNHVICVDGDARSLSLNTAPARNMLVELVQMLHVRGETDAAIDVSERLVSRERKLLRQNEADGSVTGPQALYQQKGLRGLVQTLSGIFLFVSPTSAAPAALPIKAALRVAALSAQVGLEPQTAISAWYVHSFSESKRLGHSLDLTLDDWVTLIKAFVAIELPALDPDSPEATVETIPPPPNFVFPGLVVLLKDIADTSIDLNQIEHKVTRKLMRALVYTHGREESLQLLRGLGPQFACLLELQGVDGQSHGTGPQRGQSIPTQETYTGGVHIDLYHSRFVEEWYPASPNVSIETAYERFESGAQQGIFPSPETIGRLIGGLGRLGAVDKVRTLYGAAQRVLAALENQKKWQSAGWFVVEDQMIIAFAHAGQYEAAHVHRVRIMEQGGTPSADAYGALISSLKDTTDDTAHALQLWEEALARDVRPNIFMYNTIISKLAKARKADHALMIFQQMQQQGIRPSSVTYGALIAACCRVGDAPSAELFFKEMTAAPNYKPRVPPYNTMMQLYTYTKPDRERVLHYYNALLSAKIKPSAHTYKLLLEAYGTIQPIDTAAMEELFQRVLGNPSIEVQGTHWAAMINAYGCARKDLNGAIGLFESIEKHPSTSRSKTTLPDAVVYEALFTVLSAHRRPDLIRAYLQRLRSSHVHPTAYVANAAIKGYAAAGDLESARAMFESLEDPPMGVAAPNNHALHEPLRSPNEVPPQAPIYREPSTWETMVRAELGVSERDRAMDLIRRMEFRGYPPAVVQRVRDIMHTDALSESPTSFSSLSTISSS